MTMPTGPRWERESLEPEVRLYWAVMLTAVDDARRGDTDAGSWLMTTGAELGDLLGINPDALRSHVRQLRPAH